MVDRRPGVRTTRQRPQSLRSLSTSGGAKEMDDYLGKQLNLRYEVIILPSVSIDYELLLRSHVRSSEDVNSSGYFSGDAVARKGLSRGVPLTRQRIKAKRNEVTKLQLKFEYYYSDYSISSKSLWTKKN